MYILLALWLAVSKALAIHGILVGSPLRTVAHGKYELSADEQDACEAKNGEDVSANAVSKGI